jgi:hypothetical protein
MDMSNMLQISKGLRGLMKRSGMTLEEMPQTRRECTEAMALLSSEISDIENEIQLEVDGDTDRCSAVPTWMARATRAVQHKKRQFSAIKLWRSALTSAAHGGQVDAIEQLKAKHAEKIENVRDDLNKAITKARAKAALAHVTVDRCNTQTKALLDWIKATRPDDLPEAYGVLDRAAKAFDAGDAAEGDA